MAECLRQAEAAEDDETRDKRVDAANIISYNLAADLAFCWEDGGLERNARHFNRGLKAAQDCIGWRVQLNKPPMPFSMAYWGRGIHHLALGDLRSALADFEESNSYAIKAAEAEGGPTAIDSGSGFSVLLGAGWVALAKVLLGETSAQEDYGRVIAAFTEQLESPDEHISGDAKIGLEQLEKIRNLLTGEQSREQSP
ncbi:hypothetical protein IIA79_07180 [bacterium]|nr:hypothetical protein [bacterium]